MERQRREEWERAKKEELARRRAGEQEEISRLKAKKRSLELELEAVVSGRWRPIKAQETAAACCSSPSTSGSCRATSTSRSPTGCATRRARGGS